MKNKSVPFERPPAAPIFRPTLKEFKDPLDYIQKIRSSAQKFGICKIVTPKQWNPPFAVDRHTFKFRPRVQRLNEVGAHSRMRNNFYRCLEAYCEYENIEFQPPTFKNDKIDVYELHCAVGKRGGGPETTKTKQWTQICRDLGYPTDKAKQLCSILKGYYDRVIQPYLDFCDNMYREDNKELFDNVKQVKMVKGKTALTIESTKEQSVKITRSKAKNALKPNSDYCITCSTPIYQSLPLSPSKKSLNNNQFHNNNMLICSNCDLKYHKKCAGFNDDNSYVDLKKWVCKRCLKIQCQQELAKLDNEVFGFAQSTCKYNLESFANYADNFKQTYFKKKNASLKEVEEEYWRLVAAEDPTTEDVSVKYGADICSSMTSSGFPTRNTPAHLLKEKDQQYIESGWNLNNLPILNKSIFQFMPTDISGMTVPWCYVGMVFSCFCWHIEDHWSYSINYMHTGEPKSWYGVPESNADKFEGVMRNEAKLLFDRSPDLLHHITTQLNPGLLIKHGVEVYRADQSPGEFVVTFPRAYHAGFNQGFNFAEAVNFCPADWLEKGRLSIASYRSVKRPSVFSHSELIFKMASQLDLLNLQLIQALFQELQIIQSEERASRKRLLCIGSTKTSPCRTEHVKLEEVTDDTRECVLCRTTLYVSGASCSTCFKDASVNRIVCLDHITDVCECKEDDKEFVLKYRYSLDEITSIVNNVQQRLDQYKLWMGRIYGLAGSEFASDSVTTEEGKVMRNVCQFIESLDILDEADFKKSNSTNNSNKKKRNKKQQRQYRDNRVEEKPNLEELKMLLQMGKSINCPAYLLDFLEDIIETCQKAMAMTDELLKTHLTQEQLKLEKESNANNHSAPIKDEDDKENNNNPNKSTPPQLTKQTLTSNSIKQEKSTTRSNRKSNSNSNTKEEVESPAPPQIEMAEKLTFKEMKLLVDKLHSLPAHVPQLELAANILSRVNEWKKCIRGYMINGPFEEILTPLKLKELISCCDNNIVYVSDCAMLQRMFKYVCWINEAEGLLSQAVTNNPHNNTSTSSDAPNPSLPSLAEFKKVHQEGIQLNNTIEIDKLATISESSVERDDTDEDDDDSDDDIDDDELMEIDENDDDDDRNGKKEPKQKPDYRMCGWKVISDSLTNCERKISKIIVDGEAMQKKADEILNSKPGTFALFALNSLLKSAHADLLCVVPAILRLEEVVEEAMDVNDRITETWHRLQQCRRLVHIDDLRALLTRTDSLCVAFDHAAQLRALVRTVDNWRDHLYSLFIRPSTIAQLPTPTLLEVLFPRPARQFRLMIARENALSTKLAAVCRLKEEKEVNYGALSASSTVATTTKADSKALSSTSTSSGCNQGTTAAVSIATGRQKRGALASDDPLSVRMDNVVAFENYLKSSLANTTGCSSSTSNPTNSLQPSEVVSSSSAQSNTNPSSSMVNELDFYNNYRAMCVAEMEWMWSLREMNEDKASKDSNGRDIYCVCRKRGTDQRGSQIMCDLCQDWLHHACLGISPVRDMSGRKFQCPQCERSRRPPFELIIAEKRKLEQEARMLTVPEHQALCLMCQRVINFHKHTNQLFSPQTELGAAFAEYKRLFGVQAMLPQTNTGINSSNTGGSQGNTSASSIDQYGGGASATDQLLGLSGGSVGVSGKQSRKTPHGKHGSMQQSQTLSSITTTGLATSSSTISALNNPGATNNPHSMSGSANQITTLPGQLQQHATSSSLVTPQAQQPTTLPLSSREAKAGIAKLRDSLSDEARRELEEIYIELCLLEVTQPSITWVWKLYHSLCVDDDEDDPNNDDDNGDEGLNITDDDVDEANNEDDDDIDDSRVVDTDLNIHHRHGNLAPFHRHDDDSSDDYDELSRHQKQQRSNVSTQPHYRRQSRHDSNSSSYDDDDDIMDNINYDDENIGRQQRFYNQSHKQRVQQRSDRMEYMKSLLASKRKGLERHRKNYGNVSTATPTTTSSGDRQKFAFKRKLASNVHGGNSSGHPNQNTKKSGYNITSLQRRQQQQQQRYSISSELNDDDDDDVIHLDRAMKIAAKRSSGSNVAAATASSVIGSSRHPSGSVGVSSSGRNVGSLHRQIYNDDSDEIAPTVSSSNRPIRQPHRSSPHSSLDEPTKSQKLPPQLSSKRGRRPNTMHMDKEALVPLAQSQTKKRRKKSESNTGGVNSSSGAGGNKSGSKICNDDCAASVCIQHSSETVNWVACDRCDQWFHWLCLKINSKTQIPKRFLCPGCQSAVLGQHQTKSRKKSTNPDTSTELEHSSYSKRSSNAANRKRKLSSSVQQSTSGVHKHDNDNNDDGSDYVNDDEDDDLRIDINNPDNKAQQKRSQTKKRNQSLSGTSNNSSSHNQPHSRQSSTVYHAHQQRRQHLSPTPPFLQPEIGVQEEEVEISYACKSDYDNLSE